MKSCLWDEMKIGALTVRNRIIYLSMAKYLSDDEQCITQKEIDYYTSLAKGGAGLIIPGAMVVDGDWPSCLANQPGLYDDRFIPGLSRLTRAIHTHGAKVFFQLWHPGMVRYGTDLPLKTPADFSQNEIHAIQEKFTEAAVRSKKAGADGIELQICHNYICAQFFSPAFNERTDEYGADTLENSLRFSLEILDGIHRACGQDFPISVKINGSDFREDGITPDRAAEASVLLEQAGADLICVSAGGGLTQLTGMSADGYRPEGWKVFMAETVKKKVHIPVCATGSLRHPHFIEKQILNGQYDFAGLGRGLLADYEWPNKVAENRHKEIRPCVSCMACFNRPSEENAPRCTVNPVACRDIECQELPADGGGRTVAVIGSGPAGMQAAITLAQRDFRPVIFEKEGVIGGMVRLAAAPSGKYKLNWLTEYHINMARKLHIEIRLNTPATPELLEELHPYAVITATGTTAFIPPVPGIDGDNVIPVRDILEDFPAVRNKSIVVVGSGATGTETATTLAEYGNDVTIIDMLPEPENVPLDTLFMNQHRDKAGVKIRMNRKLLRITDAAVITENLRDGITEEYPCGLVILSMGVRSDNTFYNQIKERFPNVINIGDSNIPAKIAHAIRQGYETGRTLK